MKGTSSCCQAGQVHPFGRRPCLVDRHVQPPRGGAHQRRRVTGHQQRRRAPRGQRAGRRGAVGAGSNRRAHVSSAPGAQGAGPGHRGRRAVRLPVHRRPPRVAPGRAGNACSDHRAPPCRPLMGEGCRQAERSSGDKPGPRRHRWQRPPSSTARAQDESSGGTMPTMGPRGPPRRAPGMAPGRAGNARGHHQAPPRRPLVGEGCRQAERHRAPYPHRRPLDAPGPPTRSTRRHSRHRHALRGRSSAGGRQRSRPRGGVAFPYTFQGDTRPAPHPGQVGAKQDRFV